MPWRMSLRFNSEDTKRINCEPLIFEYIFNVHKQPRNPGKTSNEDTGPEFHLQN